MINICDNGMYVKKYIKPSVIIVGPNPNSLGGIPEYIRGLIGSKLSNYYNFKIFDPLVLKKRKKRDRKSVFILKELFSSLKMMKYYLMKLIQNPDAIVHIHSSSYWGFYEKLLMAEIAHIKGHKVILHIHGGNFVKFFGKLKAKNLLLKIMANYSSVIVLTKEMKELIYNDNAVIIPNAVEVSNFDLRIEKNKTMTFLSISVLEQRKRIGLLIKAASELKDRKKDFKLIIAGDGPEKENIVKQIKKLGLADVVVYVGFVEGIKKAQLLHNADVFILASTNESFGIVIIEAMSYGNGIITTPVGISKEIIKNEVNGLIINVDNLEMLVAAMDRCITDSFVTLEMIRANRVIVMENYSWEVVADKIASLYDK